MKEKKGLLDAVACFLEWANKIRDGQLQMLLESRLFAPLLLYGLTANDLTRLREVLAVVVAGILIHGFRQDYGMSFPSNIRWALNIILPIAFATDLLDGPLARLERKWKRISDGKGAHLDPFADKLLTLPILFYYLFYLDWWVGCLVSLIIAGDVLGTAFRRYAGKRKIRIPANIFGKSKMVFLSAAILSLVLWERPNVFLFIVFCSIALTLGTISIVRHAFLLKYTLAIRRETVGAEVRREA